MAENCEDLDKRHECMICMESLIDSENTTDKYIVCKQCFTIYHEKCAIDAEYANMRSGVEKRCSFCRHSDYTVDNGWGDSECHSWHQTVDKDHTLLQNINDASVVTKYKDVPDDILDTIVSGDINGLFSMSELMYMSLKHDTFLDELKRYKSIEQKLAKPLIDAGSFKTEMTLTHKDISSIDDIEYKQQQFEAQLKLVHIQKQDLEKREQDYNTKRKALIKKEESLYKLESELGCVRKSIDRIWADHQHKQNHKLHEQIEMFKQQHNAKEEMLKKKLIECEKQTRQLEIKRNQLDVIEKRLKVSEKSRIDMLEQQFDKVVQQKLKEVDIEIQEKRSIASEELMLLKEKTEMEMDKMKEKTIKECETLRRIFNEETKEIQEKFNLISAKEESVAQLEQSVYEYRKEAELLKEEAFAIQKQNKEKRVILERDINKAKDLIERAKESGKLIKQSKDMKKEALVMKSEAEEYLEKSKLEHARCEKKWEDIVFDKRIKESCHELLGIDGIFEYLDSIKSIVNEAHEVKDGNKNGILLADKIIKAMRDKVRSEYIRYRKEQTRKRR